MDTSNENNKKTRNTNNYLYNNKLTYNTFGNKIITRNDKFNNIDKNIFISVNKINNKKDLKNSFLFLKHKKNKIITRNKNYHTYKCRPNTILKDNNRLKKNTSQKQDRLSSSVELRTNNRNKIDLKHSLPDFNPTNIKINHNYSTQRRKVNNMNLGLNESTNDKRKYKRNIGEKYSINRNDIHKKLSYTNNNNKIRIKSGKKNESIKDRNYNLYNTNSMRISDKTHDIISKRITVNKNSNIMKAKALNSSDILKKNKNDKDNINLYINRSNIKKNIKKDFNVHNNTYLERTNRKNQKHILKDSNTKKIAKTSKKINNNSIKIGKNYAFINNNYNLGKKSRNGIENSLLIKTKNTYNHYNNINHKSKNNFKNDRLNNNYRAMFNINKTYNNFIINNNSLSKKNNNVKLNDISNNKNKYAYK
jgi:hypothetical protein